MKALTLRPTLRSRILLAPPAFVVAALLYLATFGAAPGMAAAASIAVLVTYAALCLVIARRRVVVDTRAIRSRDALGGEVEIRWDEVHHYTAWSDLKKGVTVSYEFRGNADRRIDGPSAGVARHHLVVHAEGRSIVIDSGFRRPGHAIAMILAKLHARPRADDRYPPFAIRESGLVHDDAGELRWPALEAIQLRHDSHGFAPTLKVMRHDKAFPWVKVSMADFHDSMRFLERLAERGVVIDLGDVLVTRALAQRVAGNAARAAALPRAEVVRRG